MGLHTSSNFSHSELGLCDGATDSSGNLPTIHDCQCRRQSLGEYSYLLLFECLLIMVVETAQQRLRPTHNPALVTGPGMTRPHRCYLAIVVTCYTLGKTMACLQEPSSAEGLEEQAFLWGATRGEAATGVFHFTCQPQSSRYVHRVTPRVHHHLHARCRTILDGAAGDDDGTAACAEAQLGIQG